MGSSDVNEETTANMTLFFATLRQMKNPITMLIIPLTIHLGIIQGFVLGEFAAGWVACLPYFGVSKIGLSSVAYGSGHALSSICFGFLLKYTGRQCTESVGHIAGGPAFFLMFLANVENPFQDDPFSLFMIPGLFGVTVGIFRLGLTSNIYYVTYSYIYVYDDSIILRQINVFIFFRLIFSAIRKPYRGWFFQLRIVGISRICHSIYFAAIYVHE